MEPNQADLRPGDEHRANRSFRIGWILWAVLAIGLALVVLDHRAHVFGVLPYLLVLGCLLAHRLMHHGHRNHGEHT